MSLIGLLPKVNRELQALVKQDSLKQARSLAIQILNHHSAYKTYPPAGGVPKARVAGALSWRVHILPFLGEMELYNQVHLDEAWDSEHNKKLIPRMPSVFLMPNSKLTVDQGLSNICVPTGPETMWPMDRILTEDAIKDGLSRTIELLEVRDDHAQIWTEPAELTVDPSELRAVLGGHVDNEFLLVTADGAMAYWPLDMAADEFLSRLTRATGD